MSGMQSLKRASDFHSPFSGKCTRSSILEIDCWMPSKIEAISPLVDRLMRMMEGSQCVAGAEFEIELALREALGNAVVHGNREDPKTKVHVRCRCGPGREISIVVTDQGKGFDLEKVVGNGRSSRPASEHGHGIQLMKAYMDDVRFERGLRSPYEEGTTGQAGTECEPPAQQFPSVRRQSTRRAAVVGR